VIVEATDIQNASPIRRGVFVGCPGRRDVPGHPALNGLSVGKRSTNFVPISSKLDRMSFENDPYEQKREKDIMAKKQKTDANLPAVSKQTAGGVTGAVIGGIVAGPVGAVAGGVAGALVGNSSAKGEEPIKHAIEKIRSAGARGASAIKAARERRKSSQVAKPASKGAKSKKTASKPVSSKLKKTGAVATTKKAVSKPKVKGGAKGTKKKA
jgi:hypothetical protein